jgi:hypothetical protein
VSFFFVAPRRAFPPGPRCRAPTVGPHLHPSAGRAANPSANIHPRAVCVVPLPGTPVEHPHPGLAIEHPPPGRASAARPPPATPPGSGHHPPPRRPLASTTPAGHLRTRRPLVGPPRGQ